MTEIEKMKRYIERTNVDNKNRFPLRFDEARELAHMASNADFPVDIISLAFEYGKAKGYRAAKAEVRR